jgi:ribonuclease HI
MIAEDALNIYTDGSSFSKPRRGGVGIRFIFIDSTGEEVVEDFPISGTKGANSIEMELSACIQALKLAIPFLQKHPLRRIIIFTDSQFIVDNYHNAMFIWRKTRWLKKSGGPVINAELWKELVRCIKKAGIYVEIQKVKGHSKDIHNKAVDKLARQSAKSPSEKTQAGVIVRRKISREQTQLGSVKMLGQRIIIRIIESKYLTPQKITRYRYEVMSRASDYFQKVDFLCSKETFRPGHRYSVRLNRDQGNPSIIKVFKEVLPKGK